MIRTLNVILFVTSLFALTAVYGLKYAVGETAQDKAALQRQIDKQEADLSLLKADWAYLNQPAHVGPIVARHEAELNLQVLQQDQFGRFDTLPMRLKAPDTSALDSLFESLESGIDPIQQLISEAN
ncbi:MAG TPA: hypothetical protein VG757_08840 [Devosia sp.]|nr:hypothetical protein [Devosia sp.]